MTLDLCRTTASLRSTHSCSGGTAICTSGMADQAGVDRDTVLSWTTRIPWESYVGCVQIHGLRGQARDGNNMALLVPTALNHGTGILRCPRDAITCAVAKGLQCMGRLLLRACWPRCYRPAHVPPRPCLPCSVGRSASGDAVFLEAADVRAIKRFVSESPAAMTELLATGDEVRTCPKPRAQCRAAAQAATARTLTEQQGRVNPRHQRPSSCFALCAFS